MSAPPFLIRPFRPADQEAARRLILQGLAEHFGAVDETLNPDIDDIMASYVDRGHLFLVALSMPQRCGARSLSAALSWSKGLPKRPPSTSSGGVSTDGFPPYSGALADGELVGTGALIFEDGPAGQLVRVSVARDCRRLGLGRALVARLIAAGRGRGLARLWMETNDDWHAAIGLYRSCGFVAYDWQDGNIYMRLDLSRNPSPPSA